MILKRIFRNRLKIKEDINKWPFDELENVAVFTSTIICRKGEPILYVAHDEDDGAWQFQHSSLVSVDEAMIVSLKEIYDLDRSIGELASLPLGYYAERKSKMNKWVISPK